jgi:hypothetical protein
MKKIIAALSGLCCFSILCAQTGEGKFAISLSPTIGWMRTNDNLINSNGIKLGLKIGGIGEYPITEWMHLYGGASFSLSQGGKLLHKFGGNLLPDSKLSDSKYNTGEKPLPDDVQITYSVQIFEIPMGLRYLIGLPNKPFDLYLAFPEFYLGLIGKSNGKIDATGIRLEKEDIGGDVKPFNFAWGIGAGIHLPLNGDHYGTMGLHLQRGLADVTSNNGKRVTSTGLREDEDSKGTLNSLILKFAYFF